MLDPLIDLLNSRTPVYPPFGSILVIAGLFLLAWLVARSNGWVAMRVLGWHDRRHSSSDLEATGKAKWVLTQELVDESGTVVATTEATYFGLAF